MQPDEPRDSSADRRRGVQAFLHSFGYAFAGLAYVVRTQRNARIHLAVAVLVVAAGALFGLTSVEWAVIALAIGLVFSSEMINTVAEMAVDLLTQRRHPMAKAAKDVGAAAVLVAALAAAGAGIAIFGPHIRALLAAP